MPGTIVFGMDKEKIDEEKYKLEILTIVDNTKDFGFNDFLNSTNPYLKMAKVSKSTKANFDKSYEDEEDEDYEEDEENEEKDEKTPDAPLDFTIILTDQSGEEISFFLHNGLLIKCLKIITWMGNSSLVEVNSERLFLL